MPKLLDKLRDTLLQVFDPWQTAEPLIVAIANRGPQLRFQFKILLVQSLQVNVRFKRLHLFHATGKVELFQQHTQVAQLPLQHPGVDGL